MPRVCVITGSRREASCLRTLLRTDRIAVACSGAHAGRAGDLAEAALSAGCTALLSFGVAGGLDPSLAPGTLVLADAVIGPDGARFATDPRWHAAVAAEMHAGGIGFVAGAGAGTDEPLSDPAPKRRLFEGTGALCVDMESHAVMRVARRAGVPWLAVRAIADSAHDRLPDVALAALNAGGGVRYGALAARLARRPSEIAELMGLWRVSRPAFAGLGRVAALPSFCGPL